MAKTAKASTRTKKTAAKPTTVASNVSVQNSGMWDSNWIGGIVLVGLGLLFLAQAYTPFKLDNWWALFLLIPTVFAWAGAYRVYKANNRVTRQVWSAFIGGLFPALLAIIFLNSLDWEKVWPLFLILAGLAALAPAVERSTK